ncbi:hypothetical protein FJR39_24745 [Dolichospermum flos-aquae UHCC 0037]|uniref:Uncharacterized protein n=1 Tax=Dolichospermum flos-aquae UHCC 0037 TaxID=2590026 RepID=A0ACC7SCC5_DOLFA|nr:hypothetical protein [Dolichospermum flos-aquae UHCC 0037]
MLNVGLTEKTSVLPSPAPLLPLPPLPPYPPTSPTPLPPLPPYLLYLSSPRASPTNGHRKI